MNTDEAIVGIHRIGKHPAEFHAFDLLFQFFSILFDCNQGIFILLLARHLEQVARVAQSGIDVGEGMDNRFQRFFFFTEFLRAFLVVPDGRVFELAVDLFQLL